MSYFRLLLVVCFFVQSFAFATRIPAYMDLASFQKRFIDLNLEKKSTETGKTVIVLTAKDNVTEEEVQLELTVMPAPNVPQASLKAMKKVFLARVAKSQTEGKEVFT